MLLIFFGCAIQTARLAPPRPAKVATVADIPQPPQLLPLSESVGINPVRQITLHASWSWPDDMTGIVGFVVHHGTASGIYFEDFPCGLVTNLDITFNKQLGRRDYFQVEAVSDGTRTFEPSNEYTFPPPNVQAAVIAFQIDCSEPGMVMQKSADLVNWLTFTQVNGYSLVVSKDTDCTFFRTIGTNSPTLTITPIFAP